MCEQRTNIIYNNTHTHTYIPRCILFWSGPRQYISLLLGDRVCFIARILYMRTTGVLKIVKSVSRVLKTEAVFIYVAKGDGKKEEREKEKMYTINFTFRRPGAATRVGIPLTLMSIMSFAVGRVLRAHINARPLQSIVVYNNVKYIIIYGIISFFSVTRQR